MEVFSALHYSQEYQAHNGEATTHILSILHTFPFELRPSIPSIEKLTKESFEAIGAKVKGVDVLAVSGLSQDQLRELGYSVRNTLEHQLGTQFGNNPAQKYRGIKSHPPGFWSHFDDIIYRRKEGDSLYLPRQMDAHLNPQMNQIIWGNFRSTAAYATSYIGMEMTAQGVQVNKSMDLFYAGNYPVGLTRDHHALVLTK